MNGDGWIWYLSADEKEKMEGMERNTNGWDGNSSKERNFSTIAYTTVISVLIF